MRAPCEAACRRGEIDQPVSIRALKRFATERYGTESGRFDPLDLLGRVLAKSEQRECTGNEELSSLRKLLRDFDKPTIDGPRVAIIGSGPAGLAAAHDLALLAFTINFGWLRDWYPAVPDRRAASGDSVQLWSATTPLNVKAATTAPAISLIRCIQRSAHSTSPMTPSPTATAGLKAPPETEPTA